MDNLSPTKRSELMSRIKGTNTEPERALSAALDLLGIRHTRYVKKLPGTPDLVVESKKVAVFVHGCFWHGCPEHFHVPQTRREFWYAKIHRTRRRDAAVEKSLRNLGWKVVIVWEHQNPKEAAKDLAALLRRLPSPGKCSPAKLPVPLPSLSRTGTCRSGVLVASLRS